MAGRGDARISAAIARALADGPKDVVAIAAAVREAEPGLFARHEGALHGLLLERRRAGRLHEAGTSPRGLALYAQAPVAEPPRAHPLPPPVPFAVSRHALKVASAVRDPAERGRVTADLLAHLADLEARGERRSFGSVKAARQGLRRADRGRGTVHFAADGGDHVRRFVQNEGLWLLGAVAVFLIVKSFLVEVFVIPSESMVPTLLEGDRVVVFKPSGGRVPERWSIVTFQFAGQVWVKRLVALPGERIALKDGDLWVDGRLLEKPDDLREALRFPVASWDLATRPTGWVEAPVAAGTSWEPGPTLAFWAHLGPGDAVVPRDPDLLRVHDLYLDLDAERAGSGTVALVLGRAGALPSDPGVEWSLEVGPQGVLVLQSPRPWADGATTTLAEGPEAPPAGRLSLSLSFVDGVLRARAGGWSWSGRPAAPSGPARFAVVAGGDGSRALRLSMDQDLHYSRPPDARNGVPPVHGTDLFPGRRPTPEEVERALRDPDPASYAFEVPPDRVFLLGDNTTNSRDSRFNEVGPIPVEDLVGPAVFRVWPLGRVGGLK